MIGGAVARAFAREGARVFLAGRTMEKLDTVAEEIRSTGGAAETAQVDEHDVPDSPRRRPSHDQARIRRDPCVRRVGPAAARLLPGRHPGRVRGDGVDAAPVVVRAWTAWRTGGDPAERRRDREPPRGLPGARADRQRYREATQAAGKIGSYVLDWTMCREVSLEQVGYALGWSSRPQAYAAAGERLKSALDEVCKLWGIGSETK